MSTDSGHLPPGNPNLQFDHAEFSAGVPVLACTACGKAPGEYYFEINGKTLCGDCKQKIETRFKGGFKPAPFLKSAGAGGLAALIGYLIYFVIKEATGYEFGLIALLVGFMVGVAVRWGSGGSGGWLYQLLALFFHLQRDRPHLCSNGCRRMDGSSRFALGPGLCHALHLGTAKYHRMGHIGFCPLPGLEGQQEKAY